MSITSASLLQSHTFDCFILFHQDGLRLSLILSWTLNSVLFPDLPAASDDRGSCCVLQLNKSNISARTWKCELQLCFTLCDPRDCSPPGFSVHGILQARILEWIDVSFSRGSSLSRDQTHISCISCISSRILYHRAAGEALIKCLWKEEVSCWCPMCGPGW